MRRLTAAALCAALILLLFAGCREEEIPTISFAGQEGPGDGERAGERIRRRGLFPGKRGWSPTRASRPGRGIDVSSHQREIDWQAVKDAGIDFAVIRAGYRGYGSEGLIHEDPFFRQNMDGALAAGLDVGGVLLLPGHHRR